MHGGGNTITQWLSRIGKQATFVRGLRVTDEETMEVVRMTLVGKVNTELVSTLNAWACGQSASVVSTARTIEARPASPTWGWSVR